MRPCGATVPRAARRGDRRAGGADRAVAAGRLHPRRDEHRQHVGRRRDDRLRPVRIHGRVRSRRRCSARSIATVATHTAISPRSASGTWRGSPGACCRCSPTTTMRRSPKRHEALEAFAPKLADRVPGGLAAEDRLVHRTRGRQCARPGAAHAMAANQADFTLTFRGLSECSEAAASGHRRCCW